tara:strand:+ start:3252 stop:3626 length:375 start_codon:yes stop_codon:yes gene_type:complete
MASNIRFVDSLKVGAYKVRGTSRDLGISNNVDNYVLTSTGTATVNGESNLQFDGLNLGIGGASTGARFEINDASSSDLMLIRNSTGEGIKVTNSGVFQLIEFTSLPTVVEGGIVYHSNDFYVGL